MDYISREAAITAACEGVDAWDGRNNRSRENWIRAAIKVLPAADVREVVRGEWIEEKGLVPRCSVCGKYSDDAATGEAICCAFCGAMMGGQDNG